MRLFQPTQRQTCAAPVAILAALLCLSLPAPRARAQTSDQTTTQTTPANPDAAVVGAPEVETPKTPAQRHQQAMDILTTAAADKHSEVRIQALAALGTLADPFSTKLIADALADPDRDIRTAAVLAAAQSHTLTLMGKLHQALDDKEPQVAFAAATALWKLNDRSGEDILIAVVEGDRHASAGLVNNSLHTANKDLHNPSELARIGALQGASFLLGPFGIGIGAYEAMRKNGGNSARASALDLLAEEHTEPIHQEILSALNDKDAAVRAAAAKAIGAYPGPDTALALAKLFDDTKPPVRYTAAASYLRASGTPSAPTPETPHPTAKKRPTKK
jgi:HEAT repeat protein